MEIVPQSEVAEQMETACVRFLETLGANSRRKAVFDFWESERQRWHYVPREMFDRKGLCIKEMNETQRKAAIALLASGLSPTGLVKAKKIMAHEIILGRLEKSMGAYRLARDPELYYFSVFGEPATKNPWGWRAEGHHLSLHYTVLNREMYSPYPFFFGVNPATVHHGPEKGLRILSKEEDLARCLLHSLSENHKSRAIISSDAPADIITAAERKVQMGSAEGLAAESMTTEQREMLVDLLLVYINRLPVNLADFEFQKLKTENISSIHFAWAGSQEQGKPHYYRLHGPTFLTEYDNTQNDANHIHSVWRHLENDFGLDLLNLHYQYGHHGNQ
jgi:hypothetical protein